MSLWTKFDLTWDILNPVIDRDLQFAVIARALAVWDRSKDLRGVFAFSNWWSESKGSTPDFYIDCGPIPLDGDGELPYASQTGSPGTGLPPTIVLNTLHTWDANGLAQTIPHEVGHVQGLGHSDDDRDVMFPSRRGVVVPRQVEFDRLRALYNLPPIGGPTVPTAQQSAKIAFVSPPPDGVKAGEKFQVTVAITNDGLSDWQPEQPPPSNPTGKYALGDPRDATTPWGNSRFYFSGVVRSGQTVSMTIDLVAPSRPQLFGLQALLLQMVCENDKWIGNQLIKSIEILSADQPVPPASGPPPLTVTQIFSGQKWEGEVKDWRVSQ